MAGSRSLTSHVLLPVLLLAVATSVGVLALVGRATSKVREDYDRYALGSAASQVMAILDLAVSELTSAKLSGNTVVEEAKRGAVLVSIRGFWSRTGLDGVVLDGDGTVLASSLAEEVTRAVVAARRHDFFEVDVAGLELRCLAEPFPVWRWTVVNVGRQTPLRQLRPELATLLPLLTAGVLAMALGAAFVLWRFLRTPVARMVADVDADREVRPPGLAELDRIAAAVNSAMARLRARSAELAAELDRRLQAERALHKEEARIRLLLDSTAEGIFGLDRQGVITFANPAAVRLLGWAVQADLLGKGAHGLVHGPRADGTEVPDAECPVLRTARTGEPSRVTDDRFRRKDGSVFPVEYWSYPVLEDGALTGAVVGFVDITQRTTLEQQLRQAQKMEAVGRLAGGIAHDFNNMLMAIIGHASLAREEVPAGSSVQRDIDEVFAAAQRAAGMTRQILAFSRKQPIALAPEDVNEIVRGMGKVLARLLGEDVEVVLRLAPEPLVAMADRAQLEQVLLNLWANARDAMPRGGRLVVGTAPIDCDGERAAALGLEAPGRHALLTVADTGAGMSEETRQHLFEPFFTTKEQGKGTGLGLSIAYGIVRRHHGVLTAESQPGQGATFSVYLPLTEAVAARSAHAAPVEVRGGGETVLLAEDNEQVRGLARSVLEGADYRVLVAQDGEEAVALHAAHADEIALCLFDVTMPRLGGFEALEAIRRRRPAVRAIFMSGFAPDRPEPDGTLHLDKPFTPRELLRHVREVLDGKTHEEPR